MTRTTAFVTCAACLAVAAPSQAADTPPKFDVADVHASAQSTNRFSRGGQLHGSHYELRNASMLDLIQTAYGLEPDKVLGGPNWLEYDRFDVIAKAPPSTSPENLNLMLQSMLAERFKLTVRQEMKPMPAFAMTAGKHPLMKEADGTGENGCKTSIQQAGAGAIGDGPVSITISFSCHNVTMAAFADQVRNLPGPRRNGSNPPVVDKTELKGMWNFDLKYTLNPQVSGLVINDLPPAAEVLDKQLGLKLEAVSIPMPVVEVVSVSEKPSPNPPEVATAFPPLPTEFEVSEVKPSKPDSSGSMPMMMVARGGGGAVRVAAGGRGGRGGSPQLQNGRLMLMGYTLKMLMYTAWDLLSDDMMAGAPKWMDTDRFDVIAKVPSGPAMEAFTDMDSIKPLLRKLLIDSFQMKIHNEERPVPTFVLSNVKSKLKKADPDGRTKYFEGPGPDGKDPRVNNPALSRLVSCQNMTMGQFASLLPNIGGGYLSTPAVDETGIEGAWDFTLNFSAAGLVNGGFGRGGNGDSGTASDPSGGLSLFDAISKQLGLKLETVKRPGSVLVIDHVEQTPKEN